MKILSLQLRFLIPLVLTLVAAAYLALVNAENADYDVLGIQARQQIAELSKGLQGSGETSCSA